MLKKQINKIRQIATNPFMRRQMLLSTFLGPVQQRIHGNDGEYIMDADWDNLLILDGCRYDLFNQVSTDHALEGELTKFRSRGSSSAEFLQRNFRDRTYNDTVYVTANPYEKRVLGQTFHATDRVWIDDWDDEEGIVLPETIAERALSAHESYPNKRLIAHFMQPHVPFIGDTRLETRSEMTGTLRDLTLDDHEAGDIGSLTWEAVRTGTIEKEVFWEAYRDNLVRVLEEAIPLADQLPGKTVITADHGNAVGEWATPFPIPIYFHPSNIRIPVLNDVPWFVPPYTERKPIIRSAENSKTQTPDETDEIIEDRLSALGYTE